MSQLPPIPDGIEQPDGRYIVSAKDPVFGGLSFPVPENAMQTGVVVYISGFGLGQPRAMAIAVHPEGLYLGGSEGMVWARSYQQMLRVATGSPVTVSIPMKTRQKTADFLMKDAATIEIGFPSRMGGGEITLILATLQKDQAAIWVARISGARFRFEEGFGKAA